MYACTKMLRKHNILTINALEVYSVGYALANSA